MDDAVQSGGRLDPDTISTEPVTDWSASRSPVVASRAGIGGFHDAVPRGGRRSDPPVPRTRHVAVVIPACDEEATIEACLRSVNAARRRLPASVTSSVVVAADSCTDATEFRARAALRDDQTGRLLPVEVRSAGAARRAATRKALVGQKVPLRSVWVATTDADSVVAADWLTVQVRLAHEGVVAVAGVVDLDGSEDAILRHSFERAYTSSPDGTHPHVHGANMGFRADAYEAVGGWSCMVTGEDHDLWNRLCRHGPVCATTDLRVRTSPRLVGRAPAGFAADLCRLA